MEQNKKIPVIIGETGHRNIVEEDKPLLKAQIIESLKSIQLLCKGKDNGEDTPIIMLNAFAQGSDMLCAEAAFELGIDVYAVLPCPKERYIESFDNEVDKVKFFEYIDRAKRLIIAPDIEKNKSWLKDKAKISDSSYEYRQLGIYMAEHCHIMLALWDGQPPKTQYGCGTVEVIEFALKHKFLDGTHLFRPGNINDTAVIWINTRRAGDEAGAEIQKKWLISNLPHKTGHDEEEYTVSDDPPEFIKKIINETAEYNAENASVPAGKTKLWKDVDKLDEYRKSLRYHYVKADEISYNKNQRPYTLMLLILAILGMLVALTFLIYDDASLPYMIFPCTMIIGAILLLCLVGRKKGFHKKYIKYRAFAEALRIQFYLSMCLNERVIVTNVCDLYSWTQKVDMVWIEKALRALAVIDSPDKLNIPADEIVDVWIGRNEKPTGQLKYHSDKLPQNRKKAEKFDKLSTIFQIATLVLYLVLFTVEIVALILKFKDVNFFWEGNVSGWLSWRNLGAIVLGVTTIGSLLLTSFWGKLSFDRKAEDNGKMVLFYASANERWKEVRDLPDTDKEKFLKEIAREEIVENGIWCSYVGENRLEINV